jgi:hypothetical protein
LKDCEVLKLEAFYLAGTCICGILTTRWEDIYPFLITEQARGLGNA